MAGLCCRSSGLSAADPGTEEFTGRKTGRQMGRLRGPGESPRAERRERPYFGGKMVSFGEILFDFLLKIQT